MITERARQFLRFHTKVGTLGLIRSLQNRIIPIAALYLLLISTYAIVFGGADFIRAIAREDGPVENTGAVFYLLAAVVFGLSYFYSSDSANRFFYLSTRRNIFYLLLAILMLVCFGEEISWGQRIFGWNTPEFWHRINAQGETSFHNLWLFQSRNPDGSRKSFIEMLINMSRLLSIFWLSYCVCVPVAYHLSNWVKKQFRAMGFPICPLWIGGLFLVNYFQFHFIVDLALSHAQAVMGSINELKESNYAIIFFVFACHELARSTRRFS